MNSNQNERNIKFMVFEDLHSIYDYLCSEIIRQVKLKVGINLSIESRTDFYELFDKLKQEYLNNKVSFANVNFFMTDDYIFDFNDWDGFVEQSSEAILKSSFFDSVDFNISNFHVIVNETRFKNLFNNVLINYDSEIDSYNGLDVLVLKMHTDGSLIFNKKVDSNSLSSKGVYLDNQILDNIDYEFKQSDALPVACATLGIDQILKTRKIYIVAYGQERANVLQKLFYTKDYDKTIPNCLLKTHPNVVVLCDKDASAGIFKPTETTYSSLYSSNTDVVKTETVVQKPIDTAPLDDVNNESKVFPTESVDENISNAVTEVGSKIVDVDNQSTEINNQLVNEEEEINPDDKFIFDQLDDFQDIE